MNMRNLTAVIALGLAVSACGTSNRGLESVHQPVVSRSDFAFEVNTGAGGLASGDAARLSGWFDALGLGYGDKVSVDLGSSYNDGEAKAAVSAIAARYGLLLQDTPPMLGGDIAPGSARVIVSRLKASVPSCPDWSSNKGPNFGNSGSSNYGCATNTNLAAMIADPEDLIRGQRGDGTNDAQASAKAVEVYRSQSPTGKGALKSESTGGR